MKYLKEYNEKTKQFFTLSDFEDIIDIFRDMIIDEHHLEYNQPSGDVGPTYDCSTFNMHSENGTEGMVGNTYNLIVSTFLQGIEQNILYINIYSPVKNGNLIPFEKAGELSTDVDLFVKRLESMHYSVERNNFLENVQVNGVVVKERKFIETITIRIAI